MELVSAVLLLVQIAMSALVSAPSAAAGGMPATASRAPRASAVTVGPVATDGKASEEGLPPGITITFRTTAGYTVSNYERYTGASQQLMVAVCSPSALTSEWATLTTESGSSSVMLTNDLYNPYCSSGVAYGFLADLSLGYDLNELYVSFGDGTYFNDATLYMLRPPPYRAQLGAPVLNGMQIGPSEVRRVPVTLSNTGTENSSFNLSLSCTTLTACKFVASGTTSHSASLNSTASGTVMVEFTGPAAAGNGTLRVIATPTSGPIADTLDATIVSTAASHVAPKVVAGWPTAVANASGTQRLKFRVQNMHPTASQSVSSVVTCPAGFSCWAYTPTSFTLLPSRDTLVELIVTYPSSTTSGYVKLTATGSSLSSADSTLASVVTGSVAPIVTIDIEGASPGTSVARNQCLSMPAGPSAAVECGLLRVAHSVPGVRTMGVERAPTLVYLSDHGYPLARVNALVKVDRVGNLHDSLRTRFTLTSTGMQADHNWDWSPACATSTGCRINFLMNAWGFGTATGAYDYSYRVMMGYGGTPVTQTGTLTVVDDRLSIFGAGWWLEGLERLVSVDATRKLWVGGDGSSRLYHKQNDSIWTVQLKVDRPDTLKNTGSAWYRHVRNGGRVEFDALLRHVKTTNRQGHQTRFVYKGSTARLDSLVLPVPSGAAVKAYRFTWDTTASPAKLTAIIAPPQVSGGSNRVTYVNIDSNQKLMSIVDPVGDTVRYHYYYANSGLMTVRENRMRDSTVFGWSPVHTVNAVHVKMRSAPQITTYICAADSRSTVGCSIDGGLAKPTSGLNQATIIDGPRTDVSDITRIWVNKLGAPDSILDALGGRTRLRRDSLSFPGLVTSMTDPTGMQSRSVYNVRGLPDSVIAIAPFGGSNAVTTYAWDSKWDMTTQVTSPTGETSHSHIDPSTGNRSWDRRGSNDSTKVEYTYDAQNRVIRIKPNGHPADSVVYDATLGNVAWSRTPMGFKTEVFQNNVGEDTLVVTPTDAAQTGSLKMKQRSVLDVLGRVVRSETIGAAQSWSLSHGSNSLSGSAPARTAVVKFLRDKEGRDSIITRFSGTDSSASGTAQSWMIYDPAGRVVEKGEWHTTGSETMAYDEAGNLVSRTSRRNLTVTQAFDALNRLVTRITPAVSHGQAACTDCHDFIYHYQPDTIKTPYYGTQLSTWVTYDGVFMPSDVTVYAYDAAGRTLRADNEYARIRRAYYANGALKADSSFVRNYDGGAYDPWTGGTHFHLNHTYDLSGRRLTRTDNLSGSQTYSYDALGNLASTAGKPSTSADSVRAVFRYDRLGRLTTRIVAAAGDTVRWTYDDDGRPITRSEGEFADTMHYDARGKRTKIIGRSLMSDPANGSVLSAYDGLGQLAATSMNDRENITTEAITLDAHGHVKSRHTNRYQEDFGGEQLDSSSYQGSLLLSRLGTHVPDGRTNNGMPAVDKVTDLSIEYDNSGNVSQQTSIRRDWNGNWSSGGWLRQVSNGHSWSWNYYDASERLRYAQRSFYAGTGHIRTVYDEYWYDALGRRVGVRTRADSIACDPALSPSTAHCRQQWLTSAWDGDQLVYENRKYAGYHNKPPSVEGTTGGAPWYGTVRYLQTGAIDEPIVMWRDGGTARILHRNWRGNVAGATLVSTGASDNSVVWPAAISDVFMAPDLTQTLPEPNAWLGSLVADSKDATGTLYRRNRYYDPVTGRFTQEDPIGLAGGMNLYGYAGGDPINSSDPFGLCPPWPDCIAQGIADWGAKRGGAVGAVALNAGAALGATFEASGMNLAAQAGADLRQGNVASSAVNLAFALPGGNSLRGGRAAVRAGLSGLGLSDDVARGVRGVLGSGSGTQWGVQALEGGGAMVHRFVPGSNEVSAALYTYTLDGAGKVVGSAKQVYDNAGAIANTVKTYK